MQELDAINPLDGRYYEKTRALAPYFSEHALMKYRTKIECEYLIALSLLNKTSLRKFTSKEVEIIRDLYEKFDGSSFKEIKKTEKITNHDVKAVEYFIKDKLKVTSLKDSTEWVHFGLTSYDINTPARALMLSDSLENIIIPGLVNIYGELENLAKKNKDVAMLSRTHGQSASPSTFGKEMKVFSQRLKKQLGQLKDQKVSVKFSGATGNFNAHVVAYPKIDWIDFSKSFINKLSGKRLVALEANLFATQVDSHDSEAQIFDNVRRINTILLDLNQDMWRYISDGWVMQRTKEGETGSSAMPHKVNPIDFENSEGNLGLANALFEFFSRKLPISRLQRDLSDSTVERAYGTAFGHSYLAYTSLLKGLSKISLNERSISEALSQHPEVIAEAIQTILRREGEKMPYESLKGLTRGKEVTIEDIHNFIKNLKVSDTIKKELLKITPQNYIGLASKLASK